MKKENRKVLRLDIVLAVILLILAVVILYEQGIFDPLLSKFPSLKKEAVQTAEENAASASEEADDWQIEDETVLDDDADTGAEAVDEIDNTADTNASSETDEADVSETGSDEHEGSDETTSDESEDTEGEADESDNGSEEAPYYEPTVSTYDQILVNVLSAILSGDYETLAGYVSENGLRLSPMGSFLSTDVILSSEGIAAFPDRGSTLFGYRRGSGNAIYLTGSEYCQTFICPSDFDFSSASVYYDDSDDLSLVESTLGSEVHTVRYSYEPNIMEWQDIILVFVSEGDHDALAAIIHRDATTH